MNPPLNDSVLKSATTTTISENSCGRGESGDSKIRMSALHAHRPIESLNKTKERM